MLLTSFSVVHDRNFTQEIIIRTFVNVIISAIVLHTITKYSIQGGLGIWSLVGNKVCLYSTIALI